MTIYKTQIRAGYACINLALNTSFRTYRLSTVQHKEKDKISQVIWHNIKLFREIVDYNIAHNIFVYRVSSDLIPFCTEPYIKHLYEEIVLNNEEMCNHFKNIRFLREKYNLRLSIHPSQFNVLSSPKSDVVKRSVEEINTQTAWIKAVNGSNVVIHVGGGYGNKKEALKRFKQNLKAIDTSLISIENDDKTYTAYDVCAFCEPHRLKWVYDFHHDRCNPSTEMEISKLIKGYPPDKYHLSSGKPNFNSISHADYITKEDYSEFIKCIEASDISRADVVFEAKKKDLAIFNILKPLGGGCWALQ
ncbi:UV DNA damage repair endonuclease UvsE [Cellulosilyticum sp. I15G10I2]|uniref:UV DNA damage repair endonuclease UvsE n=1 Tax=Cellulosilyticum sp. I15G10I2 TaxID=1892843 RepID=UPI00085CC4B0|nr:UV DNA damage repair endonuclease UvsE [Cellulosilyticum sp. I15G10I2]